MNVSELISKLASMPLSSEVRLVRVVTEKRFRRSRGSGKIRRRQSSSI